CMANSCLLRCLSGHDRSAGLADMYGAAAKPKPVTIVPLLGCGPTHSQDDPGSEKESPWPATRVGSARGPTRAPGRKIFQDINCLERKLVSIRLEVLEPAPLRTICSPSSRE